MTSTRQKGRELVKWGVEFFKSLDPNTYEVVGSGQGKNKGDQQIPSIGVAIEWKNAKTYSMSEWIADLKKEQGIANDMTILGFRNPDSPFARPEVFFVVSAGDMYSLLEIKKNNIPAPDRIPRYKLEQMRRLLKELQDYFN
jgi:hypothetical protein